MRRRGQYPCRGGKERNGLAVAARGSNRIFF
jgi:hypothetical protein